MRTMRPFVAKDESKEIPRRASILLFVLNELGEVITELKLQKLIFQVQNKAKIKGGYQYFEHYYGPYSKELSMDTFTLMKRGLIQKEIVSGSEHPYWVFRITDKGRRYFKDVIQPNFPSNLAHRIRNVLEMYANYDHYKLTEIVYKEWRIKKPEKLASEIEKLMINLQSVKSFWEALYFPECPIIPYFLAFLEYSQDALEKVSQIKDTVIKSVLVKACQELSDVLANVAQVCSREDLCPLDVLKNICQTPDPSVSEIFGFIEDYCYRNNILPKLFDRSLSELMSGEEYQRLQKEIKNIKL